ncbi:MAG: hypothetical protein KJ985_01655, partial [Proteobacteria bacterium]|nr:hypothetical protein [Pseudomonadota bacterium]
MKKMTALTACILLVSSPAVAADLTNDESTQLQPREQATIHYQVQVDPDGTPAMLQAMQQYQFRHENTIRVRSMIQDAKQHGLPTDPLMHKVYEGIAKKANEDNIVQAVKRVQSRYEHAYQQASTLTKDKQQAKQLGQIIADAYTAGLKEQDCAQIMTQLQARTITKQ